MNRYPLWKYLLIAFLIGIACLYTLPNFFGETPAVQISTNRQAIVIDENTQKTVAAALAAAKLPHDGMFISNGSLKVRFKDNDTQFKARDVIEKSLSEGYIIAVNLIPDSPTWMAKIGARPMFLGLDLRGGVHFTMQVDMEAAKQKTLNRIAGDIRRTTRSNNIRIDEITQQNGSLTVPFQDADSAAKALTILNKNQPDATLAQNGQNIVVTLTPQQLQTIQTEAVKQNITTLHNRVNELGVAEPVIQQAGVDRIVVELPGIQDTAKAKDIIGRTATLELHMVSEDAALLEQAVAGRVPAGYQLLHEVHGNQQIPILLNAQVELTGDNINKAVVGYDQNNRPAVNLGLDANGANIFGDLTRANVGKRMAMVLIDQGKAEVVTAPVIRGEILGGQVEISGNMNQAEAEDTALLLRAGSLAAPMKIMEERTIGPSLGKENISKGFHSTLWGFVAVAGFMIIYYRMFGVFSALALACNLLFLLSILSALQATLTLPGIAAIALTLGMAIDSNVLINERIREELREGKSPQVAINKGYEHAWATILDSNITSLIVGLALLIFGSGPVRGFAIVHCLGILTSMLSSVVVSRAFVNLWYGRRRQLKTISIGTVYNPKTAAASVAKE